MLKRKILVSILLIFLIITMLISFYMIKNRDIVKKISYVEFVNLIKEDKVKNIHLNNNPNIKGVLNDGTEFVTDNPRTVNFKEYLLKEGIEVIEGESNTILDIIKFIILTFGIIFFVYYINRNKSKLAQKEMNDISEIETSTKEETSIKFDDVAGNEEAKESLKELVDFIKNPEKYEKYGARMPRGILLYGPPGTGKTLLAKALAKEANVSFLAVTGSDFVQVYAGVGASRIRSLFKSAKKHGKCVIFIDEIDAIGKKRRGMNTGNDESDRTLNALLTEMNGFKNNEGIIVIAATNRIDTLDEALLRPGRFDRQIEVGLPDVNARYKILKLHSRNKPLAKDINFERLAKETVFFSGAKLENLMNESAMIAARNNSDYITMVHIDKAYYTVIAGEEKKDRSCISKKDKLITAYHEAGHALITKLISNNRVTKVTIIPSTKGAGGFSMNLPEDKLYSTKEDIKNNIMIALAGRASEEIIFGENNITTGATNDLKRATDMIFDMIKRYGMDTELGLLNYENVKCENEIIIRAKNLIDEMYIETKMILNNNKKLLTNLTNELLNKETLNEDEINKIIFNRESFGLSN